MGCGHFLSFSFIGLGCVHFQNFQFTVLGWKLEIYFFEQLLQVEKKCVIYVHSYIKTRL